MLATAGALYQYVGTKLDEQKYPPIGKMVDVGGYKLHMIDLGTSIEGQPTTKPDEALAKITVVIETGSGESCLGWQLIQPEIAKFARVISYDRAGYAWSDASPLSRTSENIIKELHAMLQNSNVSGPYILVGHSFGGLNMQLFANTYPGEVAGVILVDSLNEKDFQKRPITLYENSVNYAIRYKKIMESYFGMKRLESDFEIDEIHNLLKDYPEFFAYLGSFQQACFAKALTTKFVVSDLEERSHFVDDAEQLRKSENLLGDKPLTVISAGKPWPGKENDDLNRVWPELQADLVTKSSRGKQVIAENSGHRINIEQPEIIVEAVREMAEELRVGK